MLVNNLLIVVLVSAASSLLAQLVMKFILHPERVKDKMEKLKNFRMERTAATKLKDQKLLRKLEKQQVRMSQIETEVSSFQFRMMMLNMVVMSSSFMLLFYTLPMGDVAGYFSASLYGVNEGISLNFYLWYFICVSFFTQIFRKAFRTGV
jgi:uncharacterized membrane protein (DUF106 family)